MNDYWYTPQPQPSSKSFLDRKRWIAWAYVGLVALVIVGVATYILLNRLDDQILTVIATVGCAGGVALPGTLLALVVLLRQNERRAREQAAPPMMPAIIVPPVTMPYPQYPQTATPAGLLSPQTSPREFIVVGEE